MASANAAYPNYPAHASRKNRTVFHRSRALATSPPQSIGNLADLAGLVFFLAALFLVRA